MKSQHQIKFIRKRPNRKKLPSKAVEHLHESINVVSSRIIVADRELMFARALSDTERNVRDSSLSSLQTWLKDNKDELDGKEIEKLWKALFYCVWMADKQPIITATIRNVVGLADILEWPFLSGLFGCLMREWFGIDRHRVDKYYELANSGLTKSIHFVLKPTSSEEFEGQVQLFVNMLQQQVWERATKEGQGFAMHILDVYVDRIVQPLLFRGKSLPGNRVHKLFDDLLKGPFFIMRTPQKYSPAIVKRILERIICRLEDVIKSDDIGFKPKFQRDMISRAAKQVMCFASDKETPDALRNTLYEIRTSMKNSVMNFDEAKKAD